MLDVLTPGTDRARSGALFVPMHGFAGLGDGTQIAGASVGAAATIAGANATAIATTLGVAVPVVGVVIAGVVLAVTAWLNRMGPKQKKWTTQIADDATAQLQQVKAAYFSTPYNPANQAAALGAVDQLLQAIQDGCGQPTMGEPGKRCIAERLVRGGSAPWCPTGTGCDYFTEYRDPIANDPRAAEWKSTGGWLGATPEQRTQMSIGEATTELFTELPQRPWFPLLIGIVALLAVFKMADD